MLKYCSGGRALRLEALRESPVFTIVGALALMPALAQTPITVSAPEIESTTSRSLNPAPETSTEFKAQEHGAPASDATRAIALQGKNAVSSSKPRYVATTSIAPRSGKSSGAKLGSATKGSHVWGTGKSSAGHTQITFFGRTGWVKSSQLKRVASARYETKRGTTLRSKAAAGKSMGSIPTDFTLDTLNNAKAKKGTWVQIRFRGKNGWVAAKDLKSVSINATVGSGATSYSDATWAKMVQQNISKHCRSTPVRVSNKKGEYYSESAPHRITLSRIGNPDPDAGNIKAVALHECAHIRQFTVYPTGFAKLKSYAEKINPRRDGRGIEHLADCMSDKMGARRSGKLADGGTYHAGYRGKCSPAQNHAATNLLANKRPM